MSLQKEEDTLKIPLFLSSCPWVVALQSVCVCVLTPPLYKDATPVGLGPHMQPYFDLMTSLKILIASAVTF